MPIQQVHDGYHAYRRTWRMAVGDRTYDTRAWRVGTITRLGEGWARIEYETGDKATVDPGSLAPVFPATSYLSPTGDE